MHYKTQSIITIAILAGLMLIVAVSIVNIEGSITGAVVADNCNCYEDTDCDDNNPETEDLCLYKDNCQAALCINTKK